jgi:hypothetical protein
VALHAASRRPLATVGEVARKQLEAFSR